MHMTTCLQLQRGSFAVTDVASEERRFRVALTFPGEKRRHIGKVAECLAKQLGKDRVLYDKFHEAELARCELDLYLPKLYRNDSELVVVFLCRKYAQKRWCRLEWKAIRTLICTLDSARIMLLSFGPPGDITELGLDPTTDGYINIQSDPPEYVAELICARLNQVPAPARPAPKTPIWQKVFVVALLVALGTVAVAAFFPSIVCSGLAKLGLDLSVCDGPMEAGDIARLQGADALSFRLPPVLGNRSEDESQAWLIRNLSGQPVGVLIGKLESGEPGSKGLPRSWETVVIPTGSQREWSTGVETESSSGVWVLLAYDPTSPRKRAMSPELYRLLLTSTEVSQFEDVSAMTLSVARGTAPNLFEISQQPTLPVQK
jgi:hypothetical protein